MPSSLLALQRAVGNRAVTRLLRQPHHHHAPAPPRQPAPPPPNGATFAAEHGIPSAPGWTPPEGMNAALEREAPYRDEMLRRVLVFHRMIAYGALTADQQHQMVEDLMARLRDRISALSAFSLQGRAITDGGWSLSSGGLQWTPPTAVFTPLDAQRSLRALLRQYGRLLQALSNRRHWNAGAAAELVHSLAGDEAAGLSGDALRDSVTAALDAVHAEPWQREVVLGYSGRRYASAHGEWRSASRLVSLVIASALNARQRTQTQASLRAVAQLPQGQTLGALIALHDAHQIPADAWAEIVSHTELRADPRFSAAATDAAAGSTADPRWSWIMTQWRQNATTEWLSRGLDEDRMEIPLLTVVCNQLGEVAQHFRGIALTGGITGDANWYAEQQRRGVAGAYLVQGAGHPEALQPGASLFFLAGAWRPHVESWTAVVAIDGAEYPNPPDPPTHDNGWWQHAPVIRPGLGEGGWNYHVTRGQRIYRERDGVRQWLAWAHEATVYRVAGGTTYTVETTDAGSGSGDHIGTAGMSSRPTSNLTGSAARHVFIGYAPPGTAGGPRR